MRRTEEEDRRQLNILRALVHEHPRELNAELYKRFQDSGGTIPFERARSVWADERRRARAVHEADGATRVMDLALAQQAAGVAVLLGKVRDYIDGEAEVDATRLRQKQLLCEQLDEWLTKTNTNVEDARATLKKFMDEMEEELGGDG